MKFIHKCPCCRKNATKKFRGVYFCDDCLKEIRKANRVKEVKGVYGEKLVGSFGQGCAIYRDIIIPLK